MPKVVKYGRREPYNKVIIPKALRKGKIGLNATSQEKLLCCEKVSGYCRRPFG